MSGSKELRNSPPHGQKREAEDDLGSEQRLAKRFNLLNLDLNGKLYVEIPKPPPVRRSRSNAVSESMSVEDSRDKIYIHNLDDELADFSSDEEKLIFLPDIEKRLTKIPKALLATEEPVRAGNEMVLYSVPSSITVPKEQDNVRKAIIESRERAREHALEHEQAKQRAFADKDHNMEDSQLQFPNYSDPDSMDMS